MKINKTTVSDEQELDPTGSIKLALPTLGTYTIKVNSKDQYGLTQKAEFKTIKNFVKTIDILKGRAEKDIYLWSETNQTATFGTKSFMIDPATPQEKNNVKWLVYDKNGAIYIPEGFALQTENSDAQKPYLAKGETFVFPIPKKEGSFTVEAYSNSKEGLKSKSSRKIEVIHPKVTEAYWAYNDGNKKKISGLSGEINHIKAHIPGYINQPVRVLCFLNDSTVVNYYNDTTTNENGEINKTLKFDAAFQKRFGIQTGKTAKIRFELKGLQDGKPYLFKKNPSAYNDAVLDVTTSAKITDAYFMYEGNRVTPFTQVPYDAKVTGVIKTLNMVGKTVTMKIYDGTIRPSVYRGKVVVNHEGVASREIVLDKKWHKTNFLQNLLNDSYYVGLEELDTKHSLENGLNAVVGDALVAKKNNTEKGNKYGIDIEYFLEKYKGINEANLKILLNDMNEYYTTEKITPKKEHVAYMLATVVIETAGTFKPIKEYGSNLYFEKMYDPILGKNEKRRNMAITNGNTKKGDGVKYCGRGYVQLTWKDNYKKIKKQFGVDVVSNPDKVMEPKLAVKIMIWGMDKGIFSGASINRYINNSKTDYINARKVINGTNRATEIAAIAENYDNKVRIIKNSIHSTTTKNIYNLSDFSKWQTQYDLNFGNKKAQDVACLKACKMILQNYGVTGGTQTGKIQTAEEENGQLYIKNSKEGIKYIDNQLKQNKPLIVGTDHTLNYGKNEGTTDHFVVIVGKGIENGKIFYLFYEVATARKESGTNDKNKLYLQEDFSLKGSPEYSKNRKYTVSQVRKNS